MCLVDAPANAAGLAGRIVKLLATRRSHLKRQMRVNGQVFFLRVFRVFRGSVCPAAWT